MKEMFFDDELIKELRKLNPQSDIQLLIKATQDVCVAQSLLIQPLLVLQETNGKINPVLWRKKKQQYIDFAENKVIDGRMLLLLLGLSEYKDYKKHAEYVKEIIKETEAMIEEVWNTPYRESSQENENGR